MTGAWEPRNYEEGLLWCFLPTETLVSETGWTTRGVQCNLRRGCIEANPGPHSKTWRARRETQNVLTPGATTPTPGGAGTIMEGIAASTSPRSPSRQECECPTSPPPPYPHLAGTDPPYKAPSVTPPNTQGAVTEQGDITPSPDSLAQLLERGSLRTLYAVQCPAWKDYTNAVCSTFLGKSHEGKIKVAWDLLLGVKRFLFFSEDKLSQRQLARELRKRAHLEGSETIAPTPSPPTASADPSSSG